MHKRPSNTLGLPVDWKAYIKSQGRLRTKHSTRLRQIALVASDLDRAERLLTKILGVEVLYRDPLLAQWDLRNILIPLGGDVIEVVSPLPHRRIGTSAAERRIAKQGDGGYMIIMQCTDAVSRRRDIEAAQFGTVIYSHETDDGHCIQYHPKIVPGGVITELDSYRTHDAPEISERYAEWHACGPSKRYREYLPLMQQSGRLRLKMCTLRLKTVEGVAIDAARQWETVFGIPRKGSRLSFTQYRQGNDVQTAELRFENAGPDKKPGIESITVEVEESPGRTVQDIIAHAQREGLRHDIHQQWLEMIGVKWFFVAASTPRVQIRPRI